MNTLLIADTGSTDIHDSTTAQLRIYLAGPGVFRPDALAHGGRLKDICARLGAVGLYPMDNDADALGDLDDDSISLTIYRKNMELLSRCDVVVADMTPFRGPSTDPGTAYEMGVAAGLGKPVVGYTGDPRPYHERMLAMGARPAPAGLPNTLWDQGGMQVEYFGQPLVDNLMMAHGAQAILSTFEDAVRYAIQHIRRPAVPGGDEFHHSPGLAV